MAELKVAIVPVGKVDAGEVEAAASRVAKVLKRPVELREAVAVPRTSEDVGRGQHRADALLRGVQAEGLRAAVAKLVGGDAPGRPVATPSPDAIVFVTDLDLFTPMTDGVFSEADPARRAALVSVRRLREAFYRRKADAGKQRARLVKEILALVGRLRGLRECPDPACAMSVTQVLQDVDRKSERYCGVCSRRL